MKKFIIIIMLLLVFSSVSLLATTWFTKVTKCPICKAENDFKVIASYGGYIYNWPSKYQYIFWPRTDSHVLYSCKKCKLTCFMWDFKNIDEKHFDDIKKALKDVKYKDEYENYYNIPMVERLKIAKKVYKIVKPDDYTFWCEFYRTAGYHEDQAGNPKGAKKARLKALEMVEKLLKDENFDGVKKENLLIKGAMQYFTDQTEKSLKCFETAQKEKYKNPDFKDEQNVGMNKYMNELLEDYIERIKYSTDVQRIIELLFEQKWFAAKIAEIKLEKKDDFTIVFPRKLLKKIVVGKQPFNFEIKEKLCSIVIGTAKEDCKNKIEIKSLKIENGEAVVSLKVADSEEKEFTCECKDDVWKIKENEKEN